MTTSLKCSLGIALLLMAATSGSAAEPLARPDFTMGANTSYGNGYGYWSGATANESFNRGRATLIRSIGERHLLDAEARRSNEEALSRRIDNVLKAHETRLTRQRMGMAEQNARFAVLQGRRNTQMAINDAERILQNPSNPTAANLETRAEARLRLAKALLSNGRQEQAMNWLKEIQTQYANTPAAAEAARILDEFNA